jgi:hypothetical protein
MMETSRGVGIALLSNEKTHPGDNGVEAPVYFDCQYCVCVFLAHNAYSLANSIWESVFCVYATQSSGVRSWTAGGWSTGFATSARSAFLGARRVVDIQRTEKCLDVGEILGRGHYRIPTSSGPVNYLAQNEQICMFFYFNTRNSHFIQNSSFPY